MLAQTTGENFYQVRRVLTSSDELKIPNEVRNFSRYSCVDNIFLTLPYLVLSASEILKLSVQISIQTTDIVLKTE